MPILVSYFNDKDDPREGNAPRHKFCDLMTISLLCALCGGDTAVDMELFGKMKVTPKHPMGQRVFVSFDVSPVGYLAHEFSVVV